MRDLSITLLCLFSLLGCQNNSSVVGTGPLSKVSGRVLLYNDAGTQLQDQSGVQILLTSPSVSKSTASAADGTWIISGLPSGTYENEFSKPGFFTVKYIHFQYGGEGNYYFGNSYVAAIPAISSLRIEVSKVDSIKSLIIRGRISNADSLSRGINILFGTTPIVDLNHIQYSFYQQIGVSPDSVNFTKTVMIDNAFLNFYGLQAGTTMYLIAYPMPRILIPAYINPSTRQYEFDNPGIALSNIDTVVVP